MAITISRVRCCGSMSEVRTVDVRRAVQPALLAAAARHQDLPIFLNLWLTFQCACSVKLAYKLQLVGGRHGRLWWWGPGRVRRRLACKWCRTAAPLPSPPAASQPASQPATRARQPL